jgi:hypothetical protein
MKTKFIRITVGQKVGLPDYSSKTIEITEEVELEEGDKRIDTRSKLFSSLDAWVEKQAAIARLESMEQKLKARNED